jgi:methanogenic corrinoid protein MtbC1
MIAKTEVTDMDSTAACPIDRQHDQAEACAAGFQASGFHSAGAGGAQGAGLRSRGLPGNGLPGNGLPGNGLPPGKARRSAGPHRPPRRRPPGAEVCGSLLAHVIESRILPRLVLAHRDEPPPPPAPVSGPRPGPRDVLLVGEIVLQGDLQPALDHLESLVAEGVPVESIYLDLLAPVARRLGELWCDDLLSFAEVTIGQVALQRLMRAFSPTFLRDAPPENPRRRILLSPMPGEQHAFGHFMVCDFFRRAGWMVSGEPCPTRAALIEAVHDGLFDVVGISLSSAARLQELGALIHVLRTRSRNRALLVIVGGKPFADQPALAWQVGADASACDARLAPARAEALIGMLATS